MLGRPSYSYLLTLNSFSDRTGDCCSGYLSGCFRTFSYIVFCYRNLMSIEPGIEAGDRGIDAAEFKLRTGEVADFWWRAAVMTGEGFWLDVRWIEVMASQLCGRRCCALP